MTNVILCGGNGTRLWPISRTDMPKQFTKLLGEKSLFQQTILRNNKLTNKFLIVCNEEHYFIALDQISELKGELSSSAKIKFILESVARNTAAAIAVSAISQECDEVLFVTPSDHVIKGDKEYYEAVNGAIHSAKDDDIALFGITPTKAHTGYGYIEVENFSIKAFHEKPEIKTAKKYFEAGNYYWNSGMFCFKAGVLLKELKSFELAIYETAFDAYTNAKNKKPIRLSKEDMNEIPYDSIDYAVMERTKVLQLVESKFTWNDLGSFDAIYEELLNKKENAISYKEHEPILLNSKDNLVVSESKKVSLIGVEDMIVIDTADALLVAKKGKSEDVKKVVDILNTQKSDLATTHPLVHRPWGNFNLLETKNNYKLKTIEVKPGKRLSLQKHFHRNEHWIVLKGTATVTIGKNKKLVRTNESVYIPMGKKHRLANDGKIDLILIEVQVGDYLKEDDIVRYDDDFKRA